MSKRGRWRRKRKEPVYRQKKCVRCGEHYLGFGRGRYCGSCRRARIAEARRRYQRKCRQRETALRKEAAGHILGTGDFRIVRKVRCAHCGKPFKPQRTTARYCGTRCRVAAHRSKFGTPNTTH
jgi:hypothetical protein